MSDLNIKKPHVFILGGGDEAIQLNRLSSELMTIVGIKTIGDEFDSALQDLIVNDDQSIINQIDTVIVTSDYDVESSALENEICRYLNKGIDVISIIDIENLQQIKIACDKGKAKFQIANIFPYVILNQFAMTLSKALSKTKFIKVQQVAILQSKDHIRLKLLGFGLTLDQAKAQLKSLEISYTAKLMNLVLGLFNHIHPEYLSFKSEITSQLATEDIASSNIKQNTIVGICISQSVYHNEKCILKLEEQWCADRVYIDHSTATYRQYPQNLNFSVHVEGEPSVIKSQIAFKNLNPDESAIAYLNAQSVLNILQIFKNKTDAGIYQHDFDPKYQLDNRLANKSKLSKNQVDQPIKKVIIWGPGEIGGAVVRAILERPDIQIVGAKVFSPHKNGKDLGALVGIKSLGIYATTDTDKLLALDADYVIVTPQPRAIVEGLDQQVIQILKAGKNVITSAAYHNVTMPNWLVSAQQPTTLLAEAIQTNGIAKNTQEQFAFDVLKKLQQPISRFPVLKRLQPILDQALKPVFDKLMPLRATPQVLQDACMKGQSFLHGTGVHPSFMAERIGIMLANFLPNPHHMRFIEAVDFSYMPDGMWGGLNTIGFGLPVDELDENFIVAKAGDFYYGDVTGNVGHLLFGARNEDIRVERRFRAIPAKEDIKVGSTIIKKGHAVALHMMHLGYIGEHHFFTNEECWYIGPNEEFRGENLPFGNFDTPISYTVEVTNQTSNQLQMQLSMDGTGRFAELLQQADISTADARCALGQVFREQGTTNPITNATAMAILDAVEGIDPGSVGIVIDDIQPRLKRVTLK